MLFIHKLFASLLVKYGTIAQLFKIGIGESPSNITLIPSYYCFLDLWVDDANLKRCPFLLPLGTSKYSGSLGSCGLAGILQRENFLVCSSEPICWGRMYFSRVCAKLLSQQEHRFLFTHLNNVKANLWFFFSPFSQIGWTVKMVVG